MTSKEPLNDPDEDVPMSTYIIVTALALFLLVGPFVAMFLAVALR